ncbi:MAG: F0F1 ATP synthase subunit B [Euzebya sp.]
MLANIILLATEGGEEASGAQIVLPATAELVWGFIAFAMLFAIIYIKVWPAVNKTLDERRAAIQGRIEEAETQLAEAEKVRRTYEESLAEARTEANQIVEDAKAQAERLKGDIVAKAEEEAAAIKSRAAADAEAERGRALQELRGQVATISVDIASKIVGAEVDQTRHNELVDSYISQLSNQN